METENAELFPFRQEKIFRDTKIIGADKIPQMRSTFKEKFEKLLSDKGLSVAQAERMSALGSGTLRKLLSNPNQSPNSRTLTAIAKGLNVTEASLLPDTDEPEDDQIAASPLPDARIAKMTSTPNMFELPKDVEVRGTAAGSHLRGAFQFSGETIEYVRRPPALIGVRDVYALYVEGSSMEPQFFPGDLVYIHSHRPARFGDPVVIQVKAGSEHEIEGTIGIYLRKTEKHIVIKKHNPPAEVQITRTAGTVIHKIMTTNELFGF
jgi:phage repressor protein C with HTH and peptisase S24 domain